MSSNTDYWAQREQDWLEECEKEEKSWNKAIDKIYTDLSAEIQEEVERFILRFGSAEGIDMATARRHLSATDIQYYASLAEKYCKQAHRDMADGTYSRDSSKEYFTEQANAEMRRYNAAMKISRLQMLQSQLALKTLNAQAKTNAVMETATIKRAESEFRRQAGILGETVLNNLDMVETLAKASFHGATFSERIWGPHQEKLQTKLNKAIRNMLILGKGAGPFTRELSRDLGVTKREAQRLLTTELARVQVQAQMESMIEAGFDQYTFITNPNCCNECRALNGKHFSLQKDKRAGRIPPIHPNCRCTTAAYVDEDTDDDFDEVEFDKWSESYDEHEFSWEEWKTTPESVKDFYVGFHSISEDDVESQLLKNNDDWVKKLTDDEYRSIDKYTFNPGDKSPNKFYQVVNRYLRGLNDSGDKDLSRHIENIENGLNKNNLPSGIICYRGQSVDSWEENSIGDYIPLEGFTSTSISPDGAFGGSIRITFKIKSANGAYLEPISKFKNQKEVLLQHLSLGVLLSKKENEYVIGVIE